MNATIHCKTSVRICTTKLASKVVLVGLFIPLEKLLQNITLVSDNAHPYFVRFPSHSPQLVWETQLLEQSISLIYVSLASIKVDNDTWITTAFFFSLSNAPINRRSYRR